MRMTFNVSPQDFIRSATRTANHYGFAPLDTLKANPACKECGAKVAHKDTAQDRKDDALYGILTSGMSLYFDNKLNAIEGPALFYSIEKTPRTGDIAVAFHVLNVQKSIAEALTIQTIRALLNDAAQAQSVVRINSLGDADSVGRYSRDLTTYLRKRLDDMPPQARELMKDHVCLALMHLIEKQHPLAEKSPNPLEYLSDQSRKHFREIVEFLDMTETPFEIDPTLTGHHKCYSDALFAIDVLDTDGSPINDGSIVIQGGRYDNFISRMTKAKVPGVGAVMILRDKKTPNHIPKTRTKPSSIYLAQLGFGPKIRSLLILEELRNAGIPVNQDITSDSLSDQLRTAEKQNASHAVIIGHKEFMENSAIVRNLNEQNQEYVPLDSLIPYLKKAAA